MITKFKAAVSRFTSFCITHNRVFLLLMVVLSLVISLNFIQSGWFLDDTFFRSLMQKDAVINERLPESMVYKWWKGFYIFFDKNPHNKAFLKDQGIVPWWTSPATQVAFWRPVSSFTLWLDFQLWPEKAGIIHLHSICWFMCLAAAAVVLYRKLIGNNALALLAALLFIVNRINYFTVAFVSNRHALVAIFFSFITLLVYTRARGKARCFAYGLFLFSLLCSEAGLINFAYILAYTLFLEQKPLREKILQLLPFLVIITGWRAGYNLLGFGAYGTELYVDPVNSPLPFLFTVFKRFPLLLVSLFLGLPADFINCFTEQAMVISALVLYPAAGTGLCFLIKKHRGSRQLWFWLSAACCSVIPLCIPIPADRNLLFASFGAVGCMAWLLHGFAGNAPEKQPGKNKGQVLKSILVVILCLNLFEGVAGIFIVPAGMKAIHKQMAALYDFGNDHELADQDLIIVTSPYVHYFYSYWIERSLERLPVPRTMQILAPGLASVALTRVDDYSLLVSPAAGFYPPPVVGAGGPLACHFRMSNFYRLLERSFIDLQEPVAPGARFRLSRMEVTVTRITADKRIAAALFTFREPLESAAFRWLTVNPGNAGYVPFTLPKPGETVVINQDRNFVAD